MATIESSIALNDQFSGVLNNIIDTMNMAISTIGEMQSAMDTEIDNSSFDAMNDSLAQATVQMQNLSSTANGLQSYIQADNVQQQKFNKSLQQGASYADNLQGYVSKALKAFVSVQGIKAAVNWIEECTDAYNEALNQQTQLMAVLANGLESDYVMDYMVNVDVNATPAEAATAVLSDQFDQIIDKANEIEAGGIYTSSAMTAAAAEFATYFDDADAITTMMDTLTNYAIGMSGVVELSEKDMVDYATNLGKIMTGSYDAMTKKGFEFSDAQKAIIEGEATQEQIVATLGEEYLDMSQDMQAAAAITQVIDDSWDGLYETMSNTPEGQVIQLSNAFDSLKASAGAQLSAGIQAFTEIIWDNWPTIESTVNGITTAMQYLMVIIGAIMDVAFSAAQVIIENWSQIEPILSAVGAALLVVGAAMAAYEIATNAAKITHSLLNAQVLIFVGIVALIAAGIYQLGSYFSQVTGLGVSGFAMIAGAANVVIQAVKNVGLTVADIGLGIWNAIQALVSNIQTAFHNAIANVQIAFYDLLSTAMEVISQIATALNKLPFVSIDVEGLASAADAYAAKAAEIEGSKGEYESISDAFNEGFSRFDTFTEGWASEAFESGAAWADNLTSVFDDIEGTNAEDFLSGYDGLGGANDLLEDIAGNTGSMAGSAADIADHLDVTDEELKYLRDIAEKDTINKFTTAEVKIDQTNNNTFSQGMDFDIILDNLTDMMDEAVDIATAGVHA